MEEEINDFLSRFEADDRQLLVVSLADVPITADRFTLVIGDESVVFCLDSAGIFVECNQGEKGASRYIAKIIQSLHSCKGKSLKDMLAELGRICLTITSDDIEGGDEGGSDYDEAGMYESDNEESTTDNDMTCWNVITELNLKQKWAEKEKSIRGALNQVNSNQKVNDDAANIVADLLDHKNSSNAKKHIKHELFSSDASYMALRNSLIELMKSPKEGMSISPIDDDIFQWSVKISAFNPDSQMTLDLTSLEDHFGYSFVEAQLVFSRDLFPFFPPFVTIKRPRLKHLAITQLTTLKCARINYWDPINGLHVLLDAIVDKLNKCSGIDIENQLNDMDSNGAYTRLEQLLLKLSLYTEIQPRIQLIDYVDNDQKDCVVTAPLKRKCEDVTESAVTEANNGGKPRVRFDYSTKGGNGFAKGTGYGDNSNPKFDLNQYQKAKEEASRLTIELLAQILNAIQNEIAAGTDNLLEARIEGSCLIPLLENHLKALSVMEIEREKNLYLLCFRLIKLLASHSRFHFMLFPLKYQESSLAELMHRLKEKLTRFSAMILRNELSSDSLFQPVTTAELRVGCFEDTNSAGNPIVVDPCDENGIMNYILLVVSCVEKLRDAQIATDSDRDATLGENNGTLADASASSSDSSDYCGVMKALQLCELAQFRDYHFTSRLRESVTSLTSKQLKRLAQEFCSFDDNLPLSESSTVWVRSLADRMDALKFAISGPEDTPYENGLFIFDAFFPNTYPQTPPLVNLCTTGGGSVRFNPNLYNCGKVCLSLLGTWPGAESESWNELHSTFLQVLVSIQSLILVSDPYFNEPGYQSSIGTETGTARSESYNLNIKIQTINHAMLHHLNHPEPGFEEVIRQHFKLKRVAIETQLAKWCAQHPDNPDLIRSAQNLSSQLIRL